MDPIQLSPSPTHPSSPKLAGISRDFIGKQKPPEAEPLSYIEKSDSQKPLMSVLPKEPEELSHEALLESYKKLALRCFQSENSLDMAKELIKSLEEAHVKQLVVIQTLETSLVQSKEVLKSLVIGTK